MFPSTIEQVRAIMDKRNNIRNISVIAGSDNEESAIFNTLNSRASINFTNKIKKELRTDKMNSAGQCKLATNSVLYYEINHSDAELIQQETSGNGFLFNLINSSKTDSFDGMSSLRVTDGAMMVIDCVEGVSYRMEKSLSDVMLENVKPIIFIDKINRVSLESHTDQEEIYQKLAKIIKEINVIVHTYGKDSVMGDLSLNPSLGNVGFGSGQQEWGFSLRQFVQMYGRRFNVESSLLMKRFWGDYFYSTSEYRWRKEPGDGYERGFSLFILNPILKLTNAIMSFNTGEILKFLQILNIKLGSEEQKLEGKALLKVCMRRWLPIENTLLEMMAIHLPSPVKAQNYRMKMLYEGPYDDEAAIGIKLCDTKAPLVVYISHVSTNELGRIYTFGRIFSGTLATGQQARLLSPLSHPGGKDSSDSKMIRVTELNVGSGMEAIGDVPCGNLVSIADIDQSLWGTCTITTSLKAHQIRTYRRSASSVVRVLVEPNNAKDLPLLVESIKSLTRTDPLTECSIEDSGEHCIAATGELHLERNLKILEELINKIPLQISEPFISYRETVSETSSQICLAKSPNSSNRLFCQALPLNDGIAMDIDKGILYKGKDSLDKYLAKNYNWDLSEARKIWAFGPNSSGPNILVDCTKGVQYVNEIRESVVVGFQWVTGQGVLCNEVCRGIRFDLIDVTLNYDAIHRGGGQIIPTARRVFNASILTAKPRILEPIYYCEIRCPQKDIVKIYEILNKRRGYVVDEKRVDELSTCLIKSCLPVATSFGFTADLLASTEGRAGHYSTFDHWELVAGDPMEAAGSFNYAAPIVTAIRKRKGLSENIQPLDRFNDEL